MSRSVGAGRHCDDTRGPQRRSLRRRRRYGGSRKARRSLPKFGITRIAEEVELFVKAEDWAGSLLCLYFKYGRSRKSAAVPGPSDCALAIGFAFLIGTGGRAALAQESPELPSKGRTEVESTTEDQIRFYKGKGPGRGNSYVERYEEDYSYLRDPARSNDFFDPLKFISLGADGEVYLTLNGEARFRYDNTDHRNFAIATAATPARTAGARPTLTPATEVSTNQLYKQRYALGADLHLGPNVRFYADLYHGQQTGHRVGPTIPGNQRDALGLVNGFGEVYGILGDAKTGFRAGRQEIFFGNNLQVRANVSTNLPSP